MIKKYLGPGYNIDQFKSTLTDLERDDQINTLIILCASQNTLREEVMSPVLKSSRLSICGGIFPEIIYCGSTYEEGILLIGLKPNAINLTITDFTNLEEMQEQIETALMEINPNHKTFFMFADALVSQKSSVFNILYNLFGTLPRYIGGGAGSLEFNPFPCLFTNEGMLQGGVIMSIVDLDTTIGVAHGWDSISTPLKVTEVEDNQIISLDWKPAMDVYQEIIETHSEKKFDFEDFFNTTKSYPFGISKLDSEKIVRDPFMTVDGRIFTLDTIAQGSHISVLFGNKSSLLKGAKSAKKRAIEKRNHDYTELFIIDCISRVLYMGDDFNEELEQLDPLHIGFGALTLGEIANNGDSFLEVYNKTAVVCAIYDDK